MTAVHRFAATVLSVACASAMGAGGPPPAPHCTFISEPVIMCSGARQAADAYHLYGSNLRAVLDTNNQRLLQEAGCHFAHGPHIRDFRILEFENGRVATSHGWTNVAQVLVDGRYNFYVAGRYLRGTCERYSTQGSERDKGPRRDTDPTTVTYSVEGIASVPVGTPGQPGGTYPK